MSADQVVDIARDAIWMILKLSAPMLVVSLVVGLIISIFQTITSIQEQTLTFIPKFLAIFLMIILCGSWLLTNLSTYVQELYQSFSQYI